MRTPWHIWLIGIVSLIWNSFGALDYVMTQTRNEAYLASFTPEQLAFFHSFPAWADGTWALAVWASVAGSILLLLRSRFAVTAFIISFIAMIITTFHNLVLAEVKAYEIMGPEAVIISIVIFIIALALMLYARAQKMRGVLR
ncbi:hypothetical protein BFP76_09920 [Amylibacter kogurei]|uniref:Sugar transporter n=1 Tax=Paramylibacter kogurei TaxID=1889778 RepID=A0A2G5K151_9RHOB|nr:hypothetical protein [Amylibacter kogurei]PIB22839.1 hypothetical protein BFP76_09920 [Amylibacter kogurei]